MICISNMDKAAVLAALYNASKQQGFGMLNAKGRTDMTISEAANLLKKNTYFDYLNGRVMKVDLSKNEFDPFLYDRDNGDEAALSALRYYGLIKP